MDGITLGQILDMEKGKELTIMFVRNDRRKTIVIKRIK